MKIIFASVIFMLTTFDIYAQDSHDVEKEVGPPAVEVSPSFPGGQRSLRKYVKKNLKYPSGTADHVGKVFISVTVNADGTLTNIQLIKGLCDVCDKNAIDVVEKMPAWIPGTVNGKVTAMRTIITIEFEL